MATKLSPLRGSNYVTGKSNSTDPRPRPLKGCPPFDQAQGPPASFGKGVIKLNGLKTREDPRHPRHPRSITTY